MNAELKMRCLELAMMQALREGKHQDRKFVVEIATEFYNHITELAPVATPAPEAVKETRGPERKPKADKAPSILD